MTATGQVGWKTPLPTGTVGSGSTLPPLVAGPVGIFAQDGAVYGLRRADGRLLWSWRGGQTVYGLWLWRGLVAVLTDQVSSHARLTGLDTATGAARWVLRLPGMGLLGDQAATADGGLAMIRADGELQVASLSSGQIRWARRVGRSPVLAAAHGLVLNAAAGRLSGYDDRSGQARWTVASPTAQPALQVLAGRVLVTSNGGGRGVRAGLTAIDPATGRTGWQFRPGTEVTVLGYGPAGLAVATYVPHRRLYLLDPRDGQQRWRAVTAVGPGTLPLITGTSVISVEGGVAGFATVRIVNREARTGALRWARALPATPAGVQPVLRMGKNVVVQASNPRVGQPAPLLAYRLTSGQPAWRASMPTFVQAPPVIVDGQLLIQPADPPQGCPDAG